MKLKTTLDFSVYVATTSSRINEASEFMRRLENLGIKISFDWTKGLIEEEFMTQNEISARAEMAIHGVRGCNVLVVLMYPEMSENMTGWAVEIGAALACGKPVVIVPYECDFGHFFSNHPLVRHAESETAAIDGINNAYKTLKMVLG